VLALAFSGTVDPAGALGLVGDNEAAVQVLNPTLAVPIVS